ncbi:MAG: preprotein translocase subunit SecE [Blastocatellia bacterium]
MSRVTDYPEDDNRPLSEEPERRAGGDDGGARVSKMPKLSFIGRIGEFYQNVKLEMRKTTWPTRTEVWSTTVVVLIAVFFFGFYLWGVDRLITLGFQALEQAIK